MMNDYISILTAEVIDLSVEVSIVLDSAQNSGQIIADVVDRISGYFDPQIRELGQNVYLSELQSIVQNQSGVLTVAGIKVFNNVGGQYSSAETSMTLKLKRLHQLTTQFLLNHHKFIKLDIQIRILKFPLKTSNLLHSLNRFIL
jgi:S-methylmethionine-dependent homocysteine/selenocysteine methylase